MAYRHSFHITTSHSQFYNCKEAYTILSDGYYVHQKSIRWYHERKAQSTNIVCSLEVAYDDQPALCSGWLNLDCPDKNSKSTRLFIKRTVRQAVTQTYHV